MPQDPPNPAERPSPLRRWKPPAIAATEAEHYAAVETAVPAVVTKPWVPASKDPVVPEAPRVAARASTAPTRDGSVSRRGSNASATPPAAPAATKRAPMASPSGSSRLSYNNSSEHSASKESKESVSLLQSSSMVRRSAVASSSAESVASVQNTSVAGSGYSSRMPTLSVRSEEAMKRHQMRMDKRREVSSTSGAVIR
eukprot:Colp12_sorted_trinity150504_noHs@26524